MSEDSPGYGETEEVPSPQPFPTAVGEGVDAPEVATLRAQLATAQEATVQALAEAEAARAEAEAHRTAAGEAEGLLRQAQDERLAAHRRALLAEHVGQIVGELVSGSTPEEMDASVGVARDAYARITNELRAQAATQVPIGASAAIGQTAEELSPMQKITHALSRNGRH